MKLEEAIKKYENRGLKTEVYEDFGGDGEDALAVIEPKYEKVIKILPIKDGEVQYEEITDRELFFPIDAFCEHFCPGSKPKLITEGPAAYDFITCDCNGLYIESCVCLNDVRVDKHGDQKKINKIFSELGKPDWEDDHYYYYEANTIWEKIAKKKEKSGTQ